MKIAIISDTHDNIKNIELFLEYTTSEKIDAIIHCGDITRKETLHYITDSFAGKVYIVLGNGDMKEDFEDLPTDFASIEIDGIKIGYTHFKEIAEKNCKNHDFVFYGHSHKPWMEDVDGCFLINPGNIAGTRYQASFAILDTETKKIELKILNHLDY